MFENWNFDCKNKSWMLYISRRIRGRWKNLKIVNILLFLLLLQEHSPFVWHFLLQKPSCSATGHTRKHVPLQLQNAILLHSLLHCSLRGYSDTHHLPSSLSVGLPVISQSATALAPGRHNTHMQLFDSAQVHLREGALLCFASFSSI